jgi:hypothetical protein
LETDDIRRISLTQDITGTIRSVFVNGGSRLINGELEEVAFDGNYAITEDEVLFVSIELSEKLKEVATNALGIPVLNLKKEKIKTLFWYEEGVYYFQGFDNRKLLTDSRHVITYSNETYTGLKEDAFIVDHIVNAVHKAGKLYFVSYVNANKIFSLSDFYIEATNEEIDAFAKHKNISISDKDWFKEHSNSVVRKQITLIQKSKVLDGADTDKIKKKAKSFKLAIELDKKGKIIFPQDKKTSKEILVFLNEQYYVGIITGTHYRTNSKRTV